VFITDTKSNPNPLDSFTGKTSGKKNWRLHLIELHIAVFRNLNNTTNVTD
jgi:hypothetical protein